MKIATICESHVPMNGGTKYQVYLGLELTKLGHEVHFFLREPQRPEWIDTKGLHYHSLDEFGFHLGDVLFCNWMVPYQRFLEAKDNWKIRILNVHDIPTSFDPRVVQSDHFIIGVSHSILSNLTYHSQSYAAPGFDFNRILPHIIACGANPDHFYWKPISEPKKMSDIIVGVVDTPERAHWYRGVREAIEICKLAGVSYQCFSANSERQMGEKIAQCHAILEPAYLAGCPTIIVETLACGRLPIVTYQGASPYVSHMVNGLIIPKANVSYVARMLQGYLQNINGLLQTTALQAYDHEWKYVAVLLEKNLHEALRKSGKRF